MKYLKTALLALITSASASEEWKYADVIDDTENPSLLSISEISTSNLSVGQVVKVSGYWGIGDGGSQTRVWNGLEWLLEERVLNVLQFGAKPNDGIDDHIYIQSAIDYAEKKGGVVNFPSGVFQSTKTIEIGNVKIKGVGLDRFSPTNVFETKREYYGTHIRFTGIGDKSYVVHNITNCKMSGGVINNTSSQGVDYNDSTYELLSFKNNDATASNVTASNKLISCAVYIKPNEFQPIDDTGTHWGIENIRLYPSFNGIDGYNSQSSTNSLGDEWDVGVYVDTAEYGNMRNAQVVGYWRMAGLLQVATNPSSKKLGAEYNTYNNCIFQGFKSLSLRNPDVTRITDLTSSTMELPFSDNNPLLQSGTIYTPKGSFTYTSVSILGDKITLQGLSNDPSLDLVVGDWARIAGTTGMYGTAFENCSFSGLSHSTRKPAHHVDIGFPFPSSAIEISGFGIRGVRFNGCQIQSFERVGVHLGEADDIAFTDCNYEPNVDNFGDAGYRFISQDANGHNSLYPAGNTSNLVLTNNRMDSDIDLEPKRGRNNNVFSDVGFFTPQSFTDTARDYPLSNNNVIIRKRKGGEFQVQNDNGETSLRIDSSGGFSIKNETLNTTLFDISPTGSLILRDSTGDDLINIFSGSGNIDLHGDFIRPSVSGAVSIGNFDRMFSNVNTNVLTVSENQLTPTVQPGAAVFFMDGVTPKIRLSNGVILTIQTTP